MPPSGGTLLAVYGCMRSTTFGVVVLLLSSVLSACGGGGGRSLDNQNPGIAIENPNLSGDKFALKIFFTATASESGAMTYGLTASLADSVSNSDLKWSNLIGDRFLIKIGNNPPLQMQLYPASGDSPAQFVLENVGPLTPASFVGLHNTTVSLLNLESQSLGQSVSTPTALASYPITIPPYSQRFLSNCVLPNSLPDVITWQGFSSTPFKIFFFKPDGSTASEFLNIADASLWQLTQSVFQSYFTPSEIIELETPQSGIGYGVDVRPGRMLLVRSAPAANIQMATNPQRSLPIIIQAREEANYQIEYQGGCSP